MNTSRTLPITNKHACPWADSSGEWKTVQLGEIVDIQFGYPFASSKFSSLPVDIRLLRGDNIAPGRLRWEGVKRWTNTDVQTLEQYHLSIGDVVLAMDRPWVGNGLKQATVQEQDLPCLLVQRVARLRAKNTVLPRFVAAVTASQPFAEHLKSAQTGAMAPHISGSDIVRYSFCLPPLEEQARIVEILDDSDAVVRAMETLIAAKLRHKHALAELLLRGKRRFPEFAGQAWRKVEVGSILKEVERPVEWDDSMFYNLVSVKRRSEGLFFRGATQGQTILTKKMKTIHSGDFLISKMQVVHGAWSKVPAQFDGYHASDSYITLVQTPDAILDMDFFNYLSQLPQTYRLALVSSHGVHIEKMTFNLTLFLRERVTIPPTVEEQRRIAETLSLADEEIRLLRLQLDCQKQIKQGLMEQLLLGRVRVREATP